MHVTLKIKWISVLHYPPSPPLRDAFWQKKARTGTCCAEPVVVRWLLMSPREAAAELVIGFPGGAGTLF